MRILLAVVVALVSVGRAWAAPISFSQLESMTANSVPYAGSNGKLTESNANLSFNASTLTFTAKNLTATTSFKLPSSTIAGLPVASTCVGCIGWTTDGLGSAYISNGSSWGPISSTFINVVDKGADTTGTNDSSAAFTAAIAALPSAGGIIYVPAGTYRLDSVVTVNKSTIFFGANMGSTVLQANFATGPVMIVTSSYSQLNNLKIDSASGVASTRRATSGANGINQQSGVFFRTSHVYVTNQYYGVYDTGSKAYYVDSEFSGNGADGYYMPGTGTPNGHETRIVNTQANLNGGNGFYVDRTVSSYTPAGIHFMQATAANNTGNGIRIGTVGAASVTDGEICCNLSNNIEILGAGVRGVHISNTHIEGAGHLGTNPTCVNVADNIRVGTNSFDVSISNTEVVGACGAGLRVNAGAHVQVSNLTATSNGSSASASDSSGTVDKVGVYVINATDFIGTGIKSWNDPATSTIQEYGLKVAGTCSASNALSITGGYFAGNTAAYTLATTGAGCSGSNTDFPIGSKIIGAVGIPNFISTTGLSLATLTAAPYSTAQNGAHEFCSDCTTATSPCTGSGTGAHAFRQNNAWKCL